VSEYAKRNLALFLPGKNRRRVVTIGLVAVLLGGAGTFAYQKWASSQSPASVMRVETVKRGNVTETVFASGTVQASKRVSLSASSGNAVIKSIRVNVGDRVKAGQVLAELDDSEARLQVKNAEANLLSAKAHLAEVTKPKTAAEINALQAKVNQAKAALDAAQSGYDAKKADYDVEKAKANLENAQRTYNTQSALYTQGIISKSEYEQAKSSLDQAQLEYNSAVLARSQTQAKAKSELEQARATYETAVADLQEAKAGPDSSAVQSAQAAVAQAEAQWQQQVKNLQDTTIKAPMDGVIVQINGNVGESPSNPFIIMDNSDAGNLEVLAHVSESDIGKVKAGLSASFTTSSYADQTFAGKVKLVYPEATTDSGVTTYQVLLSVDNKDGLLKTGMTVNASIVVGTHENVLYVPAAALKTQNGKDGVYLASAKGEAGAAQTGGAAAGRNAARFRFQPVTIGYFSSDRVEITSGLQEGDQVVLTFENTAASGSSSRSNGMGGFPGFGGMGGPGGGPGGGFGGGMRGNR
jgi:HlyD family secretion protein